MVHEFVKAEHELLQDAQPRLDGAQFGPEFNVTGHLCSVVYFLFSNTPDYSLYSLYTLLEQKTLEATE